MGRVQGEKKEMEMEILTLVTLQMNSIDKSISFWASEYIWIQAIDNGFS